LFPLLVFFPEEPGLKSEANEPASLVDVGMVVERVGGGCRFAGS
jgi:hypothetical protein